jgi:hypothetical protein
MNGNQADNRKDTTMKRLMGIVLAIAFPIFFVETLPMYGGPDILPNNLWWFFGPLGTIIVCGVVLGKPTGR